jgi:hypothetical protein
MVVYSNEVGLSVIIVNLMGCIIDCSAAIHIVLHKVLCQKCYFVIIAFRMLTYVLYIQQHRFEIVMTMIKNTFIDSDIPAVQRMESTWRHSDSHLLLMATSLMFKSAIAAWKCA